MGKNGIDALPCTSANKMKGIFRPPRTLVTLAIGTMDNPRVPTETMNFWVEEN